MRTNRYFKLICMTAAVLLTLFIPEMDMRAGTTGKISGVVLDAGTKEPLIGANILIVGTKMGATAGVDGSYFILNIPPGDYSVRATMVGYGPILQQQVRVNVDRTTTVDFKMNQSTIQGQEVVITAQRPLVEKDVTSSQKVTTSESAATLPVADIMDAVSLEPGVSVDTENLDITIRGGGNDEISFQVDGMERSDKLNDKIYAITNSASVSEIQVLTGGFNAEYGDIRSGIFNVVTKEGGRRFSGSADYRLGAAHQKHFGPNAYGQDQYDYKIYAGPGSFDAVKDVEGRQIFAGWNALAVNANKSKYLGKSDWTPQDLLDVWKWQHRPIPYGDKPDHYLDAGLGGPIPGLDKIGLNEAGFFLGYKFTREYPVLPSISEFDNYNTFEGKINFKPINSLKFVLSGLYGKTETSTIGSTWGGQPLMQYGADVTSDALGTYKYYLASQGLLDVYTKSIGGKMTHTLSPSTFYEVRYDYFTTETEAGKSRARNPEIIKTIAGVGFDEGPIGWIGEANPITDLPGTYVFYGGANVVDTSFVKSHKVNFDFTSQINKENLVKFGIEYGSDHVKRFNRKAGTIILAPNAGDFVRLNAKPNHFAGYIQDKIEYGGLIANIGLRIEHYDANSWVYVPNDIYSMIWARGGTEGYLTYDDLPKEKAKANTYLAPRIAFSHPVRQNTKFFFNYGVYYSEPSNRHRFGIYNESWDFGNGQADTRWLGNPNLLAPRTAAYEVGFEQSVKDEWLIRSYFYSKDNTDQIGQITVIGLDGSQAIGDFRNYEGVGKGACSYTTQRNNNWEDIRGIELKVTKMRGRYFTGWLTMDYVISTSGNYGLQRYQQDPLAAYYQYSAVKLQPQTQPSFIANIDFHTPNEWGNLAGDWRLSLIQRWNKGSKVIYNPTGLPTREVRTIYYWVNNYTTTFRLNKTLPSFAGVKTRVYMDVNNVFNFKLLNLGVLEAAETELYYSQFVDENTGLGNKVGDYKDKNGNNIFTENWVDKNGTTHAPLAPDKDFALFYNPRAFLFGVKVEF